VGGERNGGRQSQGKGIKKEKHRAKAEGCKNRRGKDGALTFLNAVAETQRASGIAMTTQTQTSGS